LPAPTRSSNESPRIHHATRRRGGYMATRGSRAAGGDARDWSAKSVDAARYPHGISSVGLRIM